MGTAVGRPNNAKESEKGLERVMETAMDTDAAGWKWKHDVPHA